jgi:hypothetical protein
MIYFRNNGKKIKLSAEVISSLRAYIDLMVKEWRYDKKLFHISGHLNCPYVAPSVMSVIYGWIVKRGNFPSRKQTFEAIRSHPKFLIRNDGKLGADDEVLEARVYQFLVGAYREMDVMLKMQQMNLRGRFLKDMPKDLGKNTDFIYRLGKKERVFAVERDGPSTKAHQIERGKTYNPDAIHLISRWDHSNPHGLHLIPVDLYKKYTVE